jgi:signal transduction histidine kinase
MKGKMPGEPRNNEYFLTARPRRLWLWGILTLAVFMHYADQFSILDSTVNAVPLSLTDRQALERILFLLPVVYATAAYGIRGGGAVLFFAAALMMSRATMSPGDLNQSLFQTAGVTLTGLLFILWLASERRRTDNAHVSAQQILLAQERERQRIARDLHDDTVQSLYVMAQGLDRLTSNGHDGLDSEATSQILEVRGRVVETINGLRLLIQDLRPHILNDMGLVPALEWLGDEFARRNGTRVRLELCCQLSDLDHETQILLWRIAQEALNNVGKHAEAGETVIQLRCEGSRLRLAISDDGRGFDVAKVTRESARTGKLGVSSMQERARLLGGVLTVRSWQGKGTTVSVEVPVGNRGRG